MQLVIQNETAIICLEAAIRWSSLKEVFLEISQNSQGNTCARDSFLIRFQECNFIRKESLVQVFSYELCEISKNTYFYRTPKVTDSVCFIKTSSSKVHKVIPLFDSVLLIAPLKKTAVVRSQTQGLSQLTAGIQSLAES